MDTNDHTMMNLFHDQLTARWMQKVNYASNIPTWTEPLTLCYLAELASRSQVMIECGTYVGASAKVMLSANPNLKLYCIDHFEVFGTMELCRNFTLREEVASGRCVLVKGNSETGAKLLLEGCLVLPGQADAIFVDDGHATEQVIADIQYLLPFVKSGGEMCGHDFDHLPGQNPPYNDVALGVIGSGIDYSVPVPRLWSHIKP